jgi:hypothetical protein
MKLLKIIENMDKDYYNIVGNNGEKRVYTIPVGNISEKDAAESIRNLMMEYREESEIPVDYFFPTEENFPLEFDTEEEKKYYDEWTPPTLDQICDSLEKKHKFLSDGESISIMRLVEFYRNYK